MTPNQALPLRMIAVLVPSFGVIAAGGDPDLPAATVAGGRIEARTAPARAAGVHRGQRLRDAQRACPYLAVYPADPAVAARAFGPVVAALERAAPGIEIVRPGLCVLRAAGPARYYGGESEAARVLRDAVAEVELEASGPLGAGVGIADGLLGSVLAAARDTVVPAGTTPTFLSRFGLGVLDNSELAHALRRLGVHTLGQFAALPAAKVAARFGSEGAAAHRVACGLDARPHAPRYPPGDLSVQLELDPPATVLEPLLFVAKTLADAMAERMRAGGVVCDRVEITARATSGQLSRRWWRHDGRLSALAVAERVRWQLAGAWDTLAAGGSAETADESGGVCLLQLRPDGLRVATGRQLALLGADPLPDVADAAVERLQNLLGHRAVTRPVRRGGRDPNDRIALIPFGDLDPEPPGDGPWPGRIPDPAPARVPEDPPTAELLDADGSSVAVSARGELSAPPARLHIGAARHEVVAHSAAWIAHERPWDPATVRRRARLQVATADGHAYLLALQDGIWSILAAYQ